MRLRLPGGRVTPDAFDAVGRVASRYGAPVVQVTSRSNLQLRGLPEEFDDDLVAAVMATGLIPSTTHELVRNILCSPLTGLEGGIANLTDMVGDVDAALCAREELANLPGRFLVVLDDGRGDVLDEAFDLGYQALDNARGLVFAGKADKGWQVDAHEVPQVLADLAGQFLRTREEMAVPAWHVRELPQPLSPPRDDLPVLSARPAAEPPRPRLGAHGDHAVVSVPLGLLTLEQVSAITAVARLAGADEVRVTPWRSVIIPGAADQLIHLTDAGLVTDPASPWSMVSACIGSPGCHRSAVDTRALANGLVEALAGPPALAVHITGCERVCGSPGTEHIGAVAPSGVGELMAALEVAR